MRRFELLEDPLHLALPPTTRWPARKQLRLEDLREEAWVQTSAASPCARHVVRSCHAAGFEPRVSFESDDYQTVQGLVAAGVGVALIPQLALSAVRADIGIRALHPSSPVRKVFAATRRGAAGDAGGGDDARRAARGRPLATTRRPTRDARNGTAPGRGRGRFRARRVPGARSRPGRLARRPLRRRRRRGRRPRRGSPSEGTSDGYTSWPWTAMSPSPFPPRSSAAARRGRPA